MLARRHSARWPKHCAVQLKAKPDTHALVHLGAVYAALLQNRSTLREAARAIDAEPTADFAVLAARRSPQR